MQNEDSIHIGHHFRRTVVLLAFSILVFSIFLLFQSSGVQSSTNDTSFSTCHGSFNIIIANSTSTNQLSGVVEVQIQGNQALQSTTSRQVSRVVLLGNDLVIGRARQTTTDVNNWSMPWVTSVSDNTAYTLSVRVFYSDGTKCASGSLQTVQVFNQNAGASIPVSGVSPTSWVGATNLPVDFTVLAGTSEQNFDLRPFMEFRWQAELGTIKPGATPFVGRFSSGPNPGSGSVRVEVLYAGKKREFVIPVSVLSSNLNSTEVEQSIGNTTDSNTSGNIEQSSTQEGSLNETTQQATTLTERVLQTGTIRQCLVERLGADRLTQIEQERSRFTSEEFRQYRQCVGLRSFVVLPALAPVASGAVPTLPVSEEVKINNIENTTVDIDGTQVVQLRLSGKALPNSDVLIFVFSEPLVLTTTANADGEWIYVIEDPLAPGDHEVYTVVDRGDGEFVRSGVLNFFVAQAEATAENPDGNSLLLADRPTAQQSNRAEIIFIVGTVFALVGAAVCLAVFLRHKQGKVVHGPIDSNQPPFPNSPFSQP